MRALSCDSQVMAIPNCLTDRCNGNFPWLWGGFPFSEGFLDVVDRRWKNVVKGIQSGDG
jgi:hypothetical protein